MPEGVCEHGLAIWKRCAECEAVLDKMETQNSSTPSERKAAPSADSDVEVLRASLARGFGGYDITPSCKVFDGGDLVHKDDYDALMISYSLTTEAYDRVVAERDAIAELAEALYQALDMSLAAMVAAEPHVPRDLEIALAQRTKQARAAIKQYEERNQNHGK